MYIHVRRDDAHHEPSIVPHMLHGSLCAVAYLQPPHPIRSLEDLCYVIDNRGIL